MEENCVIAGICFVAFLPDILDSKASGRNKYLQMLLSVAEEFKRSPYRQGQEILEHLFAFLLHIMYSLVPNMSCQS